MAVKRLFSSGGLGAPEHKRSIVGDMWDLGSGIRDQIRIPCL